jgi:hypothetical protein
MATDPEVQVQFPALPHFLRSSGSGMGPFSLTSMTEELLERKSSGPSLETEIMATGIHHAGYVTPSYLQKLALTSPTNGGRLVSIVHSQTYATELPTIIIYICI